MFGYFNCRNKKLFYQLIAISFFCLVFGLTDFTVKAEGATYVKTINELEAGNLEQKLVVKANGYTFEKTLAQLGEMHVLVSDYEDGTRICYIQDISLLNQFIAEINGALSQIQSGDAFYYFDEATNTFQTCPAVTYSQINAVGTELIYHKLLEIFVEKSTADKIVELQPICFDENYTELPEEIIKNRYTVKGSCTTSMRGSSSNRINNIKIAVGNINMMALYPGQEVSISEAFKPRTRENGYREAGAYFNGKTIQSTGGGICQASSTIYNAAMNSGLTVLERHPHSMSVSYLPLGLDAAIASGTKDLRIRNDYPFPVLFEGYTEGKNVTVNVYTNEQQTAGISYNLHAVRTGSLSAKTYQQVLLNGNLVEDRFIGISKYNPHLPEDE